MLPVLTRLNLSARGFIRRLESDDNSLVNSSCCGVAGSTGGGPLDVTATGALLLTTVDSSASNEGLPRNDTCNTSKRKKFSYRRRTGNGLCQFRSCQLLHNCTKNHIWKSMPKVNNLEGHPVLSELARFDGPYIISYYCSVVTTSLPCTITEITICSVHDYMW